MKPSLKSIVIDASLAIKGALPLGGSDTITAQLREWFQQDILLVVPHLWLCEVTSAIHKLMMLGGLSADQAHSVLEALLSLPVEVHAEDAVLCRMAFEWATRLGQHSAYDALYLALAEKLEAEFYTTDRRLAQRCLDLGVGFVRMLA